MTTSNKMPWESDLGSPSRLLQKKQKKELDDEESDDNKDASIDSKSSMDESNHIEILVPELCMTCTPKKTKVWDQLLETRVTACSCGFNATFAAENPNNFERCHDFLQQFIVFFNEAMGRKVKAPILIEKWETLFRTGLLETRKIGTKVLKGRSGHRNYLHFFVVGLASLNHKQSSN